MGNDVNSLENRASVSNGQTVVAALNLLKYVSFMLALFGSVVCLFRFAAGFRFLNGFLKKYGTLIDVSRQKKNLDIFSLNFIFVPDFTNASLKNGLIENNLDVMSTLSLRKSLFSEGLSL